MYSKHRLEFGVIFSGEVFNEDGEIVQQIDPFHNTVLDSGLLALYTYPLDQMVAYVNIGASSVAPDIAQTGLLDRKFSTNNQFVGHSGVTGVKPGEIFLGLRKVFQFNIGTCTGDFTEVGLSRENNAIYFNRQLFKDSNGNPIVVRVAANEGLRLTIEARIYCDASLAPYSVAYKLDTKGATAGGVVLQKVGGGSATITAAELNGIIPNATNETLKDRVDNSCTGGYQLAFFYRDQANPNLFYLFFHPHITVNPNLIMASHTFTGGTEAPTFETTMPFVAPEDRPTFEYQFEDLTAGTTITNHYRKYPYFVPYYDDICNWGVNTYNNDWILSSPIGALGFNFIDNKNPTSSSITVTPTQSDMRFVRQNYYGVGVYTTGDPIQITYGKITFNNSSSGGCYQFGLIEPIEITNIQEMWAEMEISWGRYTP